MGNESSKESFGVSSKKEKQPRTFMGSKLDDAGELAYDLVFEQFNNEQEKNLDTHFRDLLGMNGDPVPTDELSQNLEELQRLNQVDESSGESVDVRPHRRRPKNTFYDDQDTFSTDSFGLEGMHELARKLKVAAEKEDYMQGSEEVSTLSHEDAEADPWEDYFVEPYSYRGVELPHPQFLQFTGDYPAEIQADLMQHVLRQMRAGPREMERNSTWPTCTPAEMIDKPKRDSDLDRRIFCNWHRMTETQKVYIWKKIKNLPQLRTMTFSKWIEFCTSKHEYYKLLWIARKNVKRQRKLDEKDESEDIEELLEQADEPYRILGHSLKKDLEEQGFKVNIDPNDTDSVLSVLYSLDESQVDISNPISVFENFAQTYKPEMPRKGQTFTDYMFRSQGVQDMFGKVPRYPRDKKLRRDIHLYVKEHGIRLPSKENLFPKQKSSGKKDILNDIWRLQQGLNPDPDTFNKLMYRAMNNQPLDQWDDDPDALLNSVLNNEEDNIRNKNQPAMSLKEANYRIDKIFENLYDNDFWKELEIQNPYPKGEKPPPQSQKESEVSNSDISTEAEEVTLSAPSELPSFAEMVRRYKPGRKDEKREVPNVSTDDSRPSDAYFEDVLGVFSKEKKKKEGEKPKKGEKEKGSEEEGEGTEEEAGWRFKMSKAYKRYLEKQLLDESLMNKGM